MSHTLVLETFSVRNANRWQKKSTHVLDDISVYIFTGHALQHRPFIRVQRNDRYGILDEVYVKSAAVFVYGGIRRMYVTLNKATAATVKQRGTADKKVALQIRSLPAKGLRRPRRLRHGASSPRERRLDSCPRRWPGTCSRPPPPMAGLLAAP